MHATIAVKNKSATALHLNDLVIRQVEQRDLPALEWDGEYKKYRRMYADIFQDTRIGRTLMWIITTPLGEMIGQTFVMLNSSERQTADGENRAYIFAFRVKSDWRNRGVGTFLMNFVERDCRNRGFSYLTLNVAKENPDALRLYERLGFQVICSRPGRWSYKDDMGRTQHVNEPSWRMIKCISVD
jgi:ribosomal protein S18 acetylase RimI-like enzyme